ncbi:MAG: hypothetical protein AB7P56_05060 [Nitrososphaeraceae archaeon]
MLVVFLPLSAGNLRNANAIASEDEYYNEQYGERYANKDYYGDPEQDRSYSYDNDYKSNDRDNSKIVSISKINCINTNINNNGAINVFRGPADLTATGSEKTSIDSPSGNGEKYSDGSRDQNHLCVINNNNTIINNNATTDSGNENITDTCEECFSENLSPTQFIFLQVRMEAIFQTNLDKLCEFLSNAFINDADKFESLTNIVSDAGIPQENIDLIAKCLTELGFFSSDPKGFSDLSSGSGVTHLHISGTDLSNLPTAPSLGMP